MAEIEQIAPVEGAPAVSFDYAAASAALDALRATVVAVEDHGAGIDTARQDAIVHWEGRYRHELERAHRHLDDDIVAALDQLHAATGAVHQAIDDANAQQHTNNRAHELQLAGEAAIG